MLCHLIQSRFTNLNVKRCQRMSTNACFIFINKYMLDIVKLGMKKPSDSSCQFSRRFITGESRSNCCFFTLHLVIEKQLMVSSKYSILVLSQIQVLIQGSYSGSESSVRTGWHEQEQRGRSVQATSVTAITFTYFHYLQNNHHLTRCYMT